MMKRIGEGRMSYKRLTQFNDIIKEEKFSEWANNPRGMGDSRRKIYIDSVQKLEKEIYRFVEDNPEFRLNTYGKILEQNGIMWNAASMRMADVSKLDGQCIMALLVGVVRAERFIDGAVLLPFLRDGVIQNWLDRLESLDQG